MYTPSVRAVQAEDAHRDGALVTYSNRSIGTALVFDRLWKDFDLPSVFNKLQTGMRYQFSVERAVLLTVLHSLFFPRSDRFAERWKDDFAIPNAEDISLHHMYRTIDWLARRSIQLGLDHFTNHCIKDEVEELLFTHNKNLFTKVDLVFFDTTSIYLEGDGGTGRFGISSLCIVADRGIVSKDTIDKLESNEFDLRYILGVRMHKLNIFKNQDLTIDNSFVKGHL